MRILTFTVFLLFVGTMNAQSTFWGSAAKSSSAGVIYKTDSIISDYGEVYRFLRTPGINPRKSKLTEVNGKLYGMTQTNIFEFNPATSKVDELYRFRTGLTGFPQDPEGGIIQASNGKLYGLTENMGWFNGPGALIEYNLDSMQLEVKNDINMNVIGNPEGDFIEASNGKLYATSKNRGMFNQGTILEYDIALDTLKVVHSFNGTDGSIPRGNLIEVDSNRLIGMSSRGGTNSFGVIFEYNIATASFSKLHDLSDSIGSLPFGGFIMASNGLLYGMTFRNGRYLGGTILELNPINNQLRKVVDLNDSTSGTEPSGDLLEVGNGIFYGTCSDGGARDVGTIFRLDINNDSISIIHHFGITDGGSPLGSLMMNTDGDIYGMTSAGGTAGNGVLFSLDTANHQYQKRVNFAWFDNGYTPSAQLMQAEDGMLYGVSFFGGDDNSGTLFKIDPFDIDRVNGRENVSFSKLHDFDTIFGQNPLGQLIEVETGLLMGSTIRGGTNGDGTIFSYNYLSKQFNKVHDFVLNSTGQVPNGDMVLASNGKLYGTTEKGGALNLGAIYEFDIASSSCRQVAELDSTNGDRFDFGLIQASNGLIYGVTTNGGAQNDGTIVKFDPVNEVISKVHDFIPDSGDFPYGRLLEASDGYIYGVTWDGGIHGDGTIYRLNPMDDSLEVVHHFTEINGQSPIGNLIESNGKLIGETRHGGTTQQIGAPRAGTIFEVDLATLQFSKKIDIDFHRGAIEPRRGLIEVDDCHSAFLPTYSISDTMFCNNEMATLTFHNSASLNDYTNWTLLMPDGSKEISRVNKIQFTANESGKYYVLAEGSTICTNNSLLLDSINILVEVLDTSTTLIQPTILANDSTATYQWLNCDSSLLPVTGATNRLFEPIKDGNYAVEISKNGCVDTSECKQVIGVGLKDISLQNRTRISPNPVSEVIQIDVDDIQQQLDIRIIDISGRLIKEMNSMNVGKVNIPFNAKAGIYFIILENNKNDQARFRFIKH